MNCKLCEIYRGKLVVHDNDGCKLGKNVLCRRCHQRGHLTSSCIEKHPHYERPTTLEELIPADVRLKYGIITHTPVKFTTPRNVTELADINEIVIPETSNYKELGEFIEKYKIKVDKVTKDSREDRISAIKAWGVANGYRIVQHMTVPTI